MRDLTPTTLRYRSFAEWPAETFTAADGSHVSTDDHFTEDAAKAVCGMLMRYGFGGNGPRPLRTWVEELATGEPRTTKA
jgi:hypothetical protein